MTATPRTLGRRLAPLLVAMALQGLILWVPVEKLSSGTVDSIVYDTVLEETGSSELYETVDRPCSDGRERGVRGQRAGRRGPCRVTSARATYFATLPFAAAAIVAFLRFDEPRLHRAGEAPRCAATSR